MEIDETVSLGLIRSRIATRVDEMIGKSINVLGFAAPDGATSHRLTIEPAQQFITYQTGMYPDAPTVRYEIRLELAGGDPETRAMMIDRFLDPFDADSVYRALTNYRDLGGLDVTMTVTDAQVLDAINGVAVITVEVMSDLLA